MLDDSSLTSYIINVPGQTVRLELARARAASVGLETQVFAARTGDAAASIGLTPGEVGCFLSHRDLMRTIAGQPSDSLHLVLEDDVLFLDSFRPTVERIRAERPRAEVIQLGWIPPPEEATAVGLAADRARSSAAVRRFARLFRNNVTPVRPLLRRAMFGWGSHCYLITPAGAAFFAELLDVDRTIRAPLDAYLRALSLVGGPGFALRPNFPVAVQDPGLPSTIQATSTGLRQIDDRGRLLRHVD
ncbi:glycosyltransferase family 25 protein [Agromyces sp. H66]|uniref:glycosyltransferase family 25 protein n=1 Tax=Agromyces sp. H66 TaxID=2529859 RepID=UPI00145B299D|nr:glycosyltransferase family 25 protein [Agromyces sp. H66]